MTVCGRFTLRASLFKLSEAFAFTVSPEFTDFPVFEVTPSQWAPVVRMSDQGQRTLSMLRWGLVPQWSPEGNIGSKKITTHAASVTRSPYFSLFCHRRCLIPADGFYERQTVS